MLSGRSEGTYQFDRGDGPRAGSVGRTRVRKRGKGLASHESRSWLRPKCTLSEEGLLVDRSPERLAVGDSGDVGVGGGVGAGGRHLGRGRGAGRGRRGRCRGQVHPRGNATWPSCGARPRFLWQPGGRRGAAPCPTGGSCCRGVGRQTGVCSFGRAPPRSTPSTLGRGWLDRSRRRGPGRRVVAIVRVITPTNEEVEDRDSRVRGDERFPHEGVGVPLARAASFSSAPITQVGLRQDRWHPASMGDLARQGCLPEGRVVVDMLHDRVPSVM